MHQVKAHDVWAFAVSKAFEGGVPYRANPLGLSLEELEVLSVFSHCPSSGNPKELNPFSLLSSFRGEKQREGGYPVRQWVNRPKSDLI